MTTAYHKWLPAFSGGACHRDDSSIEEIVLKAISAGTSGNVNGDYRVGVFTTHLDATIEISFLRPCSSSDEVGIFVFDNVKIAAATKFGLERLFCAFKFTHIVLCRYWGKFADKLISLARKRRIPIITFIDDDLLNVPEETGSSTYNLFQDAARREALLTSFEKCDLLAFSTGRLLEKFENRENLSNFYLSDIGNSLSDEEIDSIPINSSRRNVIGYMGSASHINDLRLVAPQIILFMKHNPEFVFEVFGSVQVPEALQELDDRLIVYKKEHSYQNFLDTMRSLRWGVGIAPLEDTDFNSTKTCTKWIEYTFSGTAMLCTDVLPYEHIYLEGACEVAKPWEFSKKLQDLATNPGNMRQMLEKSVSLVRRRYSRPAHVKKIVAMLEASRFGKRDSDPLLPFLT